MKKLQAFHNDPSIKREYLSRVRKHEQQDEIIHGTYWENGKGCAVGCTIHGSDHTAYERDLGLPEWLARLEDTIFEGLPNGTAKTFPRRFLTAIPVGADLKMIQHRFLHWLLTEQIKEKQYKDFPEVKRAIERIAGLHRRAFEGKRVQKRSWQSAESAAYSAAESARLAESAAESAARAAAYSAAHSAARAAYSAAESARAAAESGSAASLRAYKQMDRKLLSLLREAK